MAQIMLLDDNDMRVNAIKAFCKEQEHTIIQAFIYSRDAINQMTANRNALYKKYPA